MSIESMSSVTIVVRGKANNLFPENSSQDPKAIMDQVAFSAAGSTDVLLLPREAVRLYNRWQLTEDEAKAAAEEGSHTTILQMYAESNRDDFQDLMASLEKEYQKAFQEIQANRVKVALLLNTPGGAAYIKRWIMAFQRRASERYAFCMNRVASLGMHFFAETDRERRYATPGTTFWSHLRDMDHHNKVTADYDRFLLEQILELGADADLLSSATEIVKQDQATRAADFKDLRTCMLTHTTPDVRAELEAKIKAEEEKGGSSDVVFSFNEQEAQRLWGVQQVSNGEELFNKYAAEMKPELQAYGREAFKTACFEEGEKIVEFFLVSDDDLAFEQKLKRIGATK